MLQIASGICYMYNMKVAHHDLKPDNIIANSMDILEVVDLEFLHVKLLDFSISKVEVKNTQVYTRRSTLRTVGYIVPESIKK